MTGETAGRSEHTHKHAVPPEVMTDPCRRFFITHHQLLRFIEFISHLALRSDEGARRAAEALYNTSSDEAEQARLRQVRERGTGARETLQSFRELILEMMFNRAVDNYLTYISE